MNQTPYEDYLRELALSLDCFTEDQHMVLTGWSESTAKAKRKRGIGPPYILLGLNYFYPRKQYAEYMQRLIRAE